MALSKEYTTCVRCGKTPPEELSFIYLPEGCVCLTCHPQGMDVQYICLPSQSLGAFCHIIAHVRSLRACSGCGYKWGSKGTQTITFEELEKNGMNRPFISALLDCGHALVEAKKKLAKDAAIDWHTKPMPTCFKCSKDKDESNQG